MPLDMRRKILPYNRNLKPPAKKLRKEMTMCETILWKALKEKQMMGFDFDRQRPIDNYIVDFYCKDLMLAIEVDGLSHSYENAAERDAIRQKRLEEMGVRFLRFDDADIKTNINGVLDIIREWILAHPELVGRVDEERHPPPNPSPEGSLVRSPLQSPLPGRDIRVGTTHRKKDTQFHFKQFSVRHDRSGMKVGTDGVLLGAWADVTKATHILDIGTGTGVIALILAQRTRPSVQIEAVEIDEHACTDAAENFNSSAWASRITLHHKPVQKITPTNVFDLIISNPPFFQNSYKPPTPKRVTARHTEDLTFSEILEITDNLLTESGKLNIILPYSEGTQFIALAKKKNFICSRKWSFRTRKEKPVERLLLEFSRKYQACEEGEILLYQKAEEWSGQYKNLIQNFYLKG